MCRYIVFTGTCTKCAGTFTWDELSQELSCLDSKNTGTFGQCRIGVVQEMHSFDQECELCMAELQIDEGYAGMEEQEMLKFTDFSGFETTEKKENPHSKRRYEESGPKSKKQRRS